MNVLIVSDTHGNISLFNKAIKSALNVDNSIEAIWHLGDNYEDCENANTMNIFYKRVPGIYHPGYYSGILSATKVFDQDSFTVGLVHSQDDLSDTNREVCDIIFHGHSHAPKSMFMRNFLYFNPGHLKSTKDRGYDATYAIASFDNNKITLNRHTINGTKFSSELLIKIENNLTFEKIL